MSWENYIGIPVAIELIMIWAYKSNQIIDGKKNVWSDDGKIKESVLDHDMILSCIFELLENFKLKEENILIDHYILSLVRELPLGFHIEKQKLNVNSISLKEILRDWKENYLKRNLYFNTLYDIAPMLGYYLALGIDIIPRYQQSVNPQNRFSHVGQMINDLSDCIPTHDSHVRTYQDQFSDIKNGIITYPIHAIYLENPKMITEALKNSSLLLDESWQEKFFQELKEQQLDEKIKNIASDSYDKHIEFWNSLLQKNDDFISRTYGLLRNNKYFHRFTNDDM